jgi:hypothetical protein
LKLACFFEGANLNKILPYHQAFSFKIFSKFQNHQKHLLRPRQEKIPWQYSQRKIIFLPDFESVQNVKF